ncbi:ABC transporter substrate-binding protein [Paenibacillus hexagrammi]|uniref:Sugar ABC transporter substrate-binding protein n=1 Tax=Paenibacillus hexagrammi TaxID=2908839 RepID=A0ABY3SP06_9BACL|nr:sugar ABC transporter substrate-binding protein [Paenibacillus sp. YPD9-1]UJF34870.1 sugar ABC transporter substrate-binding protein [Paenibacillus sp. YPD9-1]
MKSLKLNMLMMVSFSLLFLWALTGYVLLNQDMMDASSSPKPADTVKVLVRTGTESAALRQIALPFEKETGVKVEFIEVARDSYFTAVGTQLFAGSNTFDVVLMPSTSIAQFASAKAIIPLDSYLEASGDTTKGGLDIDDFFSVYRYNGSIYALPTDISTHFLYYRKDLIPTPPETWDELYEMASHYSSHVQKDSPTRWGLAMPAVVPEEREKIFDSILWSFGGDIMGDDGQVQFDSKESIRSGEYLESLVRDQLVPSDLMSWDFSRTRDGLLNGDIAMAAPYWNSAYPAIKMSHSSIKNNIAIALIPGIRDQSGTVHRMPFQHGWTLAINASSTNPAGAWRFLEFATGKEGGMIYARNGGIPARRSILSSPAFRDREDFALILESMKMAKSEPSLIYYPAMVSVEEDALAKIMTLFASPADAFQEAAVQLRNLSAHISIQSVKRSEESP